jgi:pimeloyl-ACP methyl ester carboxylesterase
MPKIELDDGVRLHYQQLGSGRDLVMIHGITGNLAAWHLKMVPVLADHFRVLTYDLRGHGYSDVPPTHYSPDDMAEDLRGLLDALGVQRPAIVGHSYGADIALYFAARHPARVSEVIAIEAALPALETLRRSDGWVGWQYWTQALEQAGHQVPPEHSSDLRYMMRATIDLPKQWGPLKGLPRNPKPLLRLLDETSLPEDYRKVGTLSLERLDTLETPVVLLYADGSAFLDTFDHLRQHLPNAHPVLLPRTERGHFGPLEQPEEVTRAIMERLLGGDAETDAAPREVPA